MASSTAHPASFRDPAGQVITDGDKLLRIVHHSYREHFRLFEQSGLKDALLSQGKIIPYEHASSTAFPEAYAVLEPERIPFISYPYEWCFSQLKEAALLTLSIQKIALAHGMILKDASAFNIQFLRQRAVHIDTLSFEKYEDGKPWVAYRQFCQHFLAPLALMANKDMQLGRMSMNFPDGIPLSTAAKTLGLSWTSPSALYMHLGVQAKLENKKGVGEVVQKVSRALNVKTLTFMAENLENTILKLPAPAVDSHWEEYQSELPYTLEEQAGKRAGVADFLARIKPKTVWDIGANSGEFSRMAAAESDVLAIEEDVALVEQMWSKKDSGVLPLWINALAPSPASGWAGTERKSLLERGPADALMALAVTHHLAITGCVPFAKQAEYFSQAAHYQLIEFISREDDNAKAMLASQPALAEGYTQEAFEAAWSRSQLLHKEEIVPGKRTLYIFGRT